jgi:hypothetical protein
VRVIRTLPANTPLGTILTIPGVGDLQAACGAGGTTASFLQTTGTLGPGASLMYHGVVQGGATDAALVDGGSAGAGVTDQALPWGFTVQVARSDGEPATAYTVSAYPAGIAGPCVISAFGWVTE